MPISLPELIRHADVSPVLRERLVLAEDGRSVTARHGERTLASAYLPVYDVTMPGAPASASFAEGIARYADELGFLAATQIDGTISNPFDDALDDQQLVELDRLTRGLHAINFFGTQRHGLLFLRVHERLVKSIKYDHGKFFSNVLRHLGMHPERIVIVLPGSAVAHRTFLGHLTRSYQDHGFKVADQLPDAGRILAVESEMARPDYVMMDANRALRDGTVKALVGYARRMGVPLIFNGVTDEAQFDLLRQYEVQLMQGPVFAEVAPPAV
jgi:EAL domain-containing protein (putative c-di-GMP-specific phosphodiesterase class I)